MQLQRSVVRESLGVPSRDLPLHNLVAQRDNDGRIVRLVVIDGSVAAA
ncbi:MAG: hypothetical protein R3F38_19260 [Gammaproteobacteria bacterium]